MSDPGETRPYRDIANRLKQARYALGLNQTEFAATAGLKKSQVANWEGGLHRPSLDACIALRETYGLSIDFIIFGNLDALPHKIARALLSNPTVSDSQ